MKMHRSLIAATALAIGIGAALPALADQTVTTTTTTKHHYVYYGDHDIYYGPETKTYYWRTSDGKWMSGTELPTESRTYITSGGVPIELDTDRPYDRDEWVVAHYKHKRDGDRDRDHDRD